MVGCAGTGSDGLTMPPRAGDGGLAAAALHCRIQAAISMATGIPSQEIDLLKAQYKSWTTAA